MAALDFLSRRHLVTVAFFNHGNAYADQEDTFVRQQAKAMGLELVASSLVRTQRPGENLEAYWREERYRFFTWLMENGPHRGPVVTAHHLDDAVETWVWSSLNGTGRLPLINYNGVLRPFLATPKEDLRDWCVRKNVPWIEDPINSDIRRVRAYFRDVAKPVVYHINPGLDKVIRKKLLKLAETDPK